MTTLKELLVRSSRTFAVGIDLLPHPLRDEVTVAYLLLRISDYLEDNRELEEESKIHMLSRWEEVLGGDSAGRVELLSDLARAQEATPDALVAREAGAVLEGLDALEPSAAEIVIQRVRESTLGMARWIRTGPDFGTESDLDDYMHEVAGRVGYLLTELFTLHVPELAPTKERMMELGREFGLALQTVNVIRGLHEDRDRGWVYVPGSFLSDQSLRGPALFEPEHRGDAMSALQRLVDKADRHLVAARSYIRLLPRKHHRVRLFCLLPLLFAVRTLAISRANPDVFHQETKMSRAEVRSITRWAMALGRSNGWIEWYCRHLSSKGRSAG